MAEYRDRSDTPAGDWREPDVDAASWPLGERSCATSPVAGSPGWSVGIVVGGIGGRVVMRLDRPSSSRSHRRASPRTATASATSPSTGPFALHPLRRPVRGIFAGHDLGHRLALASPGAWSAGSSSAIPLAIALGTLGPHPGHATRTSSCSGSTRSWSRCSSALVAAGRRLDGGRRCVRSIGACHAPARPSATGYLVDHAVGDLADRWRSSAASCRGHVPRLTELRSVSGSRSSRQRHRAPLALVGTSESQARTEPPRLMLRRLGERLRRRGGRARLRARACRTSGWRRDLLTSRSAARESATAQPATTRASSARSRA